MSYLERKTDWSDGENISLYISKPYIEEHRQHPASPSPEVQNPDYCTQAVPLFYNL
ncbi:MULTISPECIES: hypothetical protein [Clostridia]|uniref:hypothetical protein n=1 Tax=Clostridia TaxID=186801 RepID=UPI001F088223|nr:MULTISPECIES: hypothetical protein [Clostridia]MCH1935069.1 hypothetical protein [Enterocloster sp. OA11]